MFRSCDVSRNVQFPCVLERVYGYVGRGVKTPQVELEEGMKRPEAERQPTLSLGVATRQSEEFQTAIVPGPEKDWERVGGRRMVRRRRRRGGRGMCMVVVMVGCVNFWVGWRVWRVRSRRCKCVSCVCDGWMDGKKGRWVGG